jgi:diguanylate cyclase (GGDEF)-like protein
VVVVKDIFREEPVEKFLVSERMFLQQIVDGSVDPLLVIGLDHRVILMNAAAKCLFPSESLGKENLLCRHALHHSGCRGGTHFCPLQEVRRTGQATTMIYRHEDQDGECRIFEIRASPLIDSEGDLQGIIESSRDITATIRAESQLRENESRLRHLVHHDQLTDLPNRLLLQDRMEHAMACSRRSGKSLALLFLDLDRFKTINDSLGHLVGDQVLREVGERLRRCVRETDTVARLGGDEFVIIQEGIRDFSNVIVVVQKILQMLPDPIVVEGQRLYVTPSIGVSLYPNDAESVEGLMQCADVAMYQAKALGRNTYQFYTPDMNAHSHKFLLMEGDLRRALEARQFILYYQPQVDLVSGRLVGAEALLRWDHPEMGMISPDQFIPLAEETGLILPIGEWVLETACTQNRQWQQVGYPAMNVSVNISGRQFRQPGFIDMLENVLGKTGLSPEWLELEITESIVMESVHDMISTLAEIREKGIGLSIDDFGTGYSSLSYLKRFPVSKLKIDRSFVRDVVSGRDDMEIATAVIALARSMKLDVVAEGVENREQLSFLLERGCSHGQGFLFGPPCPPEDFDSYFLEPSLLPLFEGGGL